ncbi:hypothetical protein [Legionella genomosp. 1]|nr:hypothetical protein [Legionella genomosp. 1]
MADRKRIFIIGHSGAGKGEASLFSLSSDDGEIDTHVQQVINALKSKD